MIEMFKQLFGGKKKKSLADRMQGATIVYEDAVQVTRPAADFKYVSEPEPYTIPEKMTPNIPKWPQLVREGEDNPNVPKFVKIDGVTYERVNGKWVPAEKGRVPKRPALRK